MQKKIEYSNKPIRRILASYSSAYFEDVVLKYNVGDYIGAKREILNIGEEKKDENCELCFLHGLVEYNLENFNSAVEKFSQYISLSPRLYVKGLGYFHRGLAYLCTENYSDAKTDFLTTIRYSSLDDDLKYQSYLYAGNCELELENFRMALNYLEISSEHIKYDQNLFIWKAYCKISLDRKKEACSDIQEAIKLGADDLLELYFKFCK